MGRSLNTNCLICRIGITAGVSEPTKDRNHIQTFLFRSRNRGSEEAKRKRRRSRRRWTRNIQLITTDDVMTLVKWLVKYRHTGGSIYIAAIRPSLSIWINDSEPTSIRHQTSRIKVITNTFDGRQSFFVPSPIYGRRRDEPLSFSPSERPNHAKMILPLTVKINDQKFSGKKKISTQVVLLF